MVKAAFDNGADDLILVERRGMDGDLDHDFDDLEYDRYDLSVTEELLVNVEEEELEVKDDDRE